MTSGERIGPMNSPEVEETDQDEEIFGRYSTNGPVRWMQRAPPVTLETKCAGASFRTECITRMTRRSRRVTAAPMPIRWASRRVAPNGSTLSEAPQRKSGHISFKLALSIEPFEGMSLRGRTMEFEL